MNEARRDALTDPANRRLFEEFLCRELECYARYNHPIALLFIDSDNFKSVNDSCGRLEGDSALKQLADVLRCNVRAGDIVARYGGGELIVAVWDPSDKPSNIDSLIEGADRAMYRAKEAGKNSVSLCDAQK